MRQLHALFVHLPTPYAYAAVFLVLLVEGVGLPGVPFEPFFLASGLLIAQGRLQFWPVVVVAAAGNLSGNLVGYGLGLWAGPLLRGWLVRRLHVDPARLDAVQAWVKRYGGRAVFVGRWFGPVRSPAILAAGMARTPLGDYVLWSALAALSWVSAWQLLAWRFGGAAAGLWGRFGLLLLGGLAVLAAVVLLLLRRLRAERPELGPRLLTLAGLAGPFGDGQPVPRSEDTP